MNSDLAGDETLPSAVCRKSYPNMEQIEKPIEEFRKGYRSTSLRLLCTFRAVSRASDVARPV